MKNKNNNKKILFMLLLFAVISVTQSCINSEKSNEIEISNYLDEIEVIYEGICKEAGMEVWTYYSDTSISSTGLYKEKFSRFFLNDTLVQNISSWYTNISTISNDTLRRRIELWYNTTICSQVDFDENILKLQNNLEEQITDFPSENFTATEIEQGIVQLIKLRNQKARALGYSNYAKMILQNTGCDTIWFENLINVIDSMTLDKYSEIVENIKYENGSFNANDIRPFLIQSYQLNYTPNIDNDKKEELIKLTLEQIGININDKPIKFEIADLPPGIGGFGNCIDIPNDFRAVIMEDLSFRDILHEIGHGLHWTNVSIQPTILKGYEWCAGNLSDLYCESMAETIAKFSQNKYWLLNNGYSQNETDSINEVRKMITPVMLRFNLAQSLFEIELYNNPNKSVADIKHDLYKKYLFIDRDFSKTPNLLRLSYISYPIYEQNYLIADIISSQIHDDLESKFGNNYALNPLIGNVLKTKYWENGELISWHDRLIKSTGKDLDVINYLRNKGF